MTAVNHKVNGVKPLAGPPAVGQDVLDGLLVKTSRTFALSIPVLPEPTRREVTVAYLLFRIADTLEDSTLWSRERKLEEECVPAMLLVVSPLLVSASSVDELTAIKSPITSR